MYNRMTAPMTREFNVEMARSLREFSGTLARARQPQWQASFQQLAASFERVGTHQDRSRLAEQGLAYFSQPHGLNDWLKAREGMLDSELYRILEVTWMLIQELLKRYR